MTTTQSHPRSQHRSAQALRRLGRAMKSRSMSLDRNEDVRSKMAHAEQAQFVRSFRM